ncbi:hypothetical protein D6D27_03378 [Aureobasidium pullulans]|nr:hypothetical protein D6D27_03378 [Aureobasidium pullulans]
MWRGLDQLFGLTPRLLGPAPWEALFAHSFILESAWVKEILEGAGNAVCRETSQCFAFPLVSPKTAPNSV